MSTNGDITARALRELADLRTDRARKMDARREKVYSTVGEIATIDRTLRALVVKCAATALDRGAPGLPLESIRDESLALQARRERLLKESGFSVDYLEDKPTCALCSDTGFVGARHCVCLKKICARLRREELSKSLNIKGQSFDTFDLSLFSDQPDTDTGLSPRENMEALLEYCTEYAWNFQKTSDNICFMGGTGLGKTFMSSCIAGAVAERGFSVVYDTAAGLFSAFEAEKFGRAMEGRLSEPYLACDLLILDDLGTEMVTNFTLSALYTVINSRLITGKKTLISTNLDKDGLRRKYTAPILSRLEGEYSTFYFFGNDLRLGGRRVGNE